MLVDEYQDTNSLQAGIVLKLGGSITVVGDDAQSIYAFRGATVRNILDFPSHFDPPAGVVKLEQNYRSVQPILDASNAVIGKSLFSERRSEQKPILVAAKDEQAQADYIVERVLANREAGVLLHHQAVLMRTAHLRPARNRAGSPEHPVCEIRWLEVPRSGAREGPDLHSALGRESERRYRWIPRIRAPNPQRRYTDESQRLVEWIADGSTVARPGRQSSQMVRAAARARCGPEA